MNRIINLFTNDIIRKAIAVCCAFFLWHQVQGAISVDRQVKFDVTTLSQQGLGQNNFTLRVTPPDGWKLTNPSSGDTISIWFRGSNSELQNFTASQCSASIVVHFDADSTQDRIDFIVSPSELDWLRPGDAHYLLKDINRAQPLQKLTFERITENVHVLDYRDIAIVGETASTHIIDVAQARFINHSQVTLTGPKFAMNRLQLQLSYQGDGSLPSLLNPLRLATNTRQDVHPRLHLADEWEAAGIRMSPRQIDVSVPVRLRQSAKFVWLPSATDLQILQADDSVGEWQVRPWEPTQWIAELPNVSATDARATVINTQWINDHVVLLLPLSNLSSDSFSGTSLAVQATLIGFENTDDLLFYQQNMRIRAIEPDDAMVTVLRIEQ